MSDAPSPRYTIDEIVAAGRKAQRRRRAGWATASAGLAVVGVVTAVSVGLPGGPPRPTIGQEQTMAAASAQQSHPADWEFPQDPFQYVFQGYDAGKLHVKDPIVASAAYQIAPVLMDGLVTANRSVAAADASKHRGVKQQGPGHLYAYLTVYRPGAFDAQRFTGTRVTVGGHPAIEQEGPRDGGNLHRALAWEYTADAWAVVDSFAAADAVSATDLRPLVAGLRPIKPVPARVPFTVGYLPTGYQAAELGQHAMAGLNGVAAAADGDHGGAIFARPALPTTGLTTPYGGPEGADPPGSFTIHVLPSKNSNQVLKDGQRPPAEPSCGNGFCTAWTSDGRTTIQVASGGRLSDSEMVKILRGIRLADLSDESTWPQAATALRAD